MSAATDLRGLSVFLPQFTLQLFTKKERTEMKANLNVADVDGYHEQLNIILQVLIGYDVLPSNKKMYGVIRSAGENIAAQITF